MILRANWCQESANLIFFQEEMLDVNHAWHKIALRGPINELLS